VSNFDSAIQYTLLNEGGFTDDAADSGGATNFGITHSDLARFRGKPVTTEDVRNMTREEASLVYRQFFWNPMGLDQIDDLAIATALFDVGVNQGLRESIFMAQVALGIKPADSVLGANTATGINACEPKRFLRLFAPKVQLRYVGIVLNNPAKLTFLPGWTNRAMRLLSLMDGVL
jgi:lysozyme family protein